jgi:hypothetical protein
MPHPLLIADPTAELANIDAQLRESGRCAVAASHPPVPWSVRVDQSGRLSVSWPSTTDVHATRLPADQLARLAPVMQAARTALAAGPTPTDRHPGAVCGQRAGTSRHPRRALGPRHRPARAPARPRTQRAVPPADPAPPAGGTDTIDPTAADEPEPDLRRKGIVGAPPTRSPTASQHFANEPLAQDTSEAPPLTAESVAGRSACAAVMLWRWLQC